MSVYSTVSLSTDKALKILQMNLYNLSNKQLEDILFTIFKNKTFNNFSVTDLEPRCDDEVTERFLKDIF